MDIDREIVEAVDKLYGDKIEPIRAEKIVKKVCREIGADSFGFPADMITNALLDDPNYVAVYEENPDMDCFFSRRAFFGNAQFCIRLTEFEIKNGVLVVGHRFSPFFKPLEKVRLSIKRTKKNFKEKICEYPLRDIRIYYTFFGTKGMLDVISSEHEDNSMNLIDALMSETKNDSADSMMKITVYDMKDFFHEKQLAAKDILLLTIKDYEKKVCEVEALKAEELKARAWERAEWIKLLSMALRKGIKSIEAGGYMETIDVFLARTLFFGGTKLLENPPAPLVSILDGDSDFELKLSEGGYVVIWEKNRPFELKDDIYDMMSGEDGFPDEDMGEDFDLSEREESEFDNYCEEMGFSWTRDELEAFMRDELFVSGGKKPSGLDKIISRCFDDRIEKHYPELKKPFWDEVEKIWEEVSGAYNIFQDNPQGKVRKKALEILEQHCGWMRKLDKNGIGRTLKLQDALEELANITGPIYDLVTQLNRPVEFKSGQIESFNKMLDMIKIAHKAKTEELENKLR